MATPAFDPAAFDPFAFEAGALGVNWRPVVTLGGVDVSASVSGEIRVEAAEASARVAEFTLLLAPGASLNLPAYVGVAVTIDYATRGSAGEALSPVRLFTGVVDLPEFDRASRSVRFVCTDDLPGACATTTFAALDTLTGGVWSPVLFDETLDGWQYARDLMSTVPSALDLSPAGALRVTPWAPAGVADMVFSESEVLDGSLRVQLANRSAVRNQIDVEFSFRFPRLRARDLLTAFNAYDEAVDNVEFPVIDGLAGFLSLLPWFATRAAVEEAAASVGGRVEAMVFDPPPASGVYFFASGDPFIFAINEDVRADLCLGWTGTIRRHFGQVVDEVYAIRVHNAASVAALGVIPEERSAALEVEFDIDAWEAAANAPAGTTVVDPVLSGAGPEIALDYFPSTDSNRAAADAAIVALVREASTRIHATHRESSVAFASVLDPTLDTTKTIEVNAQGVHARGKCRAVAFVMNLDTGEALSETEVAVCSLQGVGYSHPADPATPPAASTPPAPGVGAIFDATSSFEWRVAALSHPVTITSPAVEAEARDNLEVPVSQTYAAGFPEDVFEVIA